MEIRVTSISKGMGNVLSNLKQCLIVVPSGASHKGKLQHRGEFSGSLLLHLSQYVYPGRGPFQGGLWLEG